MKTITVVLVATLTLLYGRGLAYAQAPTPVAPQAVGSETMVVSGIVPVTPGAPIVIEALDPVTIRGIECARSQSVAAPDAGPASSRFSLTVDRSCVRRVSGNLRVCWGDQKCQGIEFEPGRRVELGALTPKPSVAFPPDAGSGPDDHAAGSSGSVLSHALGVAGLVIATLALGFGVVAVFRPGGRGSEGQS